MIYFTADTHFGHCNILKYCNRPFKDFDHMNEEMVSRFNEVLKPGDILYHLGDVKHSAIGWKETVGRLNTKNIHLILGNHDNEKDAARSGMFASISKLRTVSADGCHFTLCHYAMRTWSSKGRGGMQLYGHSHGRLPGLGRQMDVGVDTNNFYPYSLEDIVNKMKDIPFNVEEIYVPSTLSLV